MGHRLASFISGGGTTMEQIALACRSGEIPDMKLACVIASSETAGGIKRALGAGILEKDIVVIDPKKFPKKDPLAPSAFGEAILKELNARGITVAMQNGWLPLTPTNVIAHLPKTLFNQHPGPPEFGGKGMHGIKVHSAVRRFADHVHRVITHTHVIAQYVHPEFDKGAVVRYEKVRIYPFDTPEDIQVRALPNEHHNSIALLQDFARGKVREVTERIPLVLPGEEALLQNAITHGIRAYPNT